MYTTARSPRGLTPGRDAKVHHAIKGSVGVSRVSTSARSLAIATPRPASGVCSASSSLICNSWLPSKGRIQRNPDATHHGRPSVRACAADTTPPPHAEAHMAGEAPYTPQTKPSEEILSLWRRADAVCFDVDCTVTINDSLDLLAKYMGCEEAVEALTNQAMDGSMNLAESLDERLRIINCTPQDIRGFLKANPPEARLVPNIAKLITALQSRGIQVYLLTGGFRELVMPLAAHLGVPKANILANRMNWQWDDATGQPTRLVGFDPNQPTARNGGKPAAIAELRNMYPYNTILMVGDGITDLEAAEIEHGADLFIGYGGVIERSAVARAAKWFVYDHQVLIDSLPKYKVAMIGSGAWASASVKMVAENARKVCAVNSFEDKVVMWVNSSDAEIINKTHMNKKYLPGVTLPDNVVACPNLKETVQDADILIFCAPHQYLYNVVKELKGLVKPDAIAISLTKGMRVRKQGPQLISQMISKNLNIDCSVLMGANIAEEVAREQLSEAVIGYTSHTNAELLQKLFQTPYFNVTLINDVAGAELCGTLKNIVALGTGIVDGLDLGPNTKSTIIRQGLSEMRCISKAIYESVRDETFMESCGVGDLMATCYGGRNRAVAQEWTKRWKEGSPKTFDQLETELLKGQKLQGVLTSNEMSAVIEARGWQEQYPLFTTINRIINGKLPPTWITRFTEGAKVSLESLSSGDSDGLPSQRVTRSRPVDSTAEAVAARANITPARASLETPEPESITVEQIMNDMKRDAVATGEVDVGAAKHIMKEHIQQDEKSKKASAETDAMTVEEIMNEMKDEAKELATSSRR